VFPFRVPKRWLVVTSTMLACIAIFSANRANANPVGLQYAPAGTLHLSYVPDSDLAAEGITLRTPPAGTTSAVTQQQAEKVGIVVAARYGASAVRQSVLAEVDESTRSNLPPKLLWVLDIQPPAGGLLMPWQGAGELTLPDGQTSTQTATPFHPHAKYVLVFIDPKTGNFDSDDAFAPLGFQ
jgi:hypothetical protein